MSNSHLLLMHLCRTQYRLLSVSVSTYQFIHTYSQTANQEMVAPNIVSCWTVDAPSNLMCEHLFLSETLIAQQMMVYGLLHSTDVHTETFWALGMCPSTWDITRWRIFSLPIPWSLTQAVRITIVYASSMCSRFVFISSFKSCPSCRQLAVGVSFFGVFSIFSLPVGVFLCQSSSPHTQKKASCNLVSGTRAACPALFSFFLLLPDSWISHNPSKLWRNSDSKSDKKRAKQRSRLPILPLQRIHGVLCESVCEAALWQWWWLPCAGEFEDHKARTWFGVASNSCTVVVNSDRVCRHYNHWCISWRGRRERSCRRLEIRLRCSH